MPPRGQDFNCWEYAFRISNAGTNFGDYEITLTGEPFNDAYRYVDWLLTVPLSFIELLCVIDVPDEIQDDQSRRFVW